MKNNEEDALRWLRQAENDLEFARLALSGGFFSQACFVAHQVAEKALKALAYFRSDRYVTGHSISDLVDSLESTYSDLTRYAKPARELDKYYVPTRYPDALPGGVPFESYDSDDAETAVGWAVEIVGITQRIVRG